MSLHRVGRRLALVAVAGLAVGSGACNKPRYAFEPRPPSPPAADDAERCYQDQRLELAAGRVDYQRHEVYTAASYMVTVTRFFAEGGLTVYHRGHRLDARAALTQIGDPALEGAYDALLAPTASAHRAYPRWRTAMLVTAVPATAATLGGALWWGATGLDEKAPAYLMLGGLSLLLVSLVPTTGALLTKDDHLRHERQLELFTNQGFAPRLVEGASEHNRRAAQRCGHGEPDLPMTPTVRGVLGPP